MRYVTICILVILGLSFFVNYRGIRRDASHGVAIYTSESFCVPHQCKSLALLGCTPHPTVYLSQHKNPKPMKDLTLEDILDLAYLKDSFTQVLSICANTKIDHLLIAYLPIYFVKMRQLLKEAFVDECKMFLDTIGPQIATFIRDLKKELGIPGLVLLYCGNLEPYQGIDLLLDSFQSAYKKTSKLPTLQLS